MYDPKTLDAVLAEAEAKVPNITPGAEKEIIWAGGAGAVTDLAVVYIHGFSATKYETRPVPDDVAKALGANLYYARLEGHGRDGAAMAEPTWDEWLQDALQALDVGRAIGQHVLVMSCSTGCTLTAIALCREGMDDRVVGNVMISPNFGMASKLLNLVLGLPWAEKWLPAIAGKERGFDPISPEHEKWWTTRYPSQAVFTMMNTVHAAWKTNPSDCRMPTLVLSSDSDRVVSLDETRRYLKNWGGHVSEEVLVMGPKDDQNGHLIAGDVFSPTQTKGAVERILSWWSVFHKAH